MCVRETGGGRETTAVCVCAHACICVCVCEGTASLYSYGCNMCSLCGGTGKRESLERRNEREGSQKRPVQLAGMHLLPFY